MLVACPDARPPAYQAVIGLDRAGKLREFVTASYYDPAWPSRFILAGLHPVNSPGWSESCFAATTRKSPRPVVHTVPSFDLLLRLEARLGQKLPGLSRALAQCRTERFDAQLASMIDRTRPEVLLAFSDVGSMAALPLCRRLGIKTIVSMVHGDVREEQELLEREDRFLTRVHAHLPGIERSRSYSPGLVARAPPA